MPPGSISRYEKAPCTCQIAFGKDAPIKKKLLFHRTTRFAGMRDRIPVFSSPLSMGAIVQIPCIEMKPSSSKALVDINMGHLVVKGVESP